MKSIISLLQDRLDTWSLTHEFPPGMAIGLFDQDTTETLFWGRRYLGSTSAIDESIRWHIGSCAKSLTAYLIFTLVKEKRFEYETKLGDVITDVALNPRLNKLTISELLCHCSGLRDSLELFSSISQDRMLDAVEGRRDLLRSIPFENCASEDKGFNYSNLGYCLLGTVVDSLEGSFELALSNKVLKPLALNSAAFGPPLTGAKGHLFHDGRLMPIEPEWYADNHPVLSPAGRIHLTLSDWISYLRFLLHGEFCNVWDDPHQVNYTYGSFVKRDRENWIEYSHSGSNRLWYASVSMIPAIHKGIVVATNWGGGVKETSNINSLFIDEFWRSVLR